jgi:hypothetical protein
MYQMYSEISQILNVYPEQIDALLSEYRDGYRALEPKQYFMDLHLQTNDTNTGNIVAVTMNLSGTIHQFQEPISERIPLRTIVEFDTQVDAIIAIAIEATASPNKTRVTISTIEANSPYLVDFLSALLIPQNITQLYNEERQKLAQQIQVYSDIPRAS